MKKDGIWKAGIAAALLCTVAAAGYGNIVHTADDIAVVAKAEAVGKAFKWDKQIVEKGTTVDAAYLWPNEVNPRFTAVYRNGQEITDTMITVEPGSSYHFRGISDGAALYTQVYVGFNTPIDVGTGETGMWYRLLPSAIRKEFEEGGWKWETGWEYTGRAYLDSENSRIMMKSDDHTAVLYGMGLYLDSIHNYKEDAAFTQEIDVFESTFGTTENAFASALEYYYTKGGELRSTCPKIYAMVADAMSQLDTETARIRENTMEEPQTSEDETPDDANNEPSLLKEMLEFANEKREEAGLLPIAWNDADNENIKVRAKEVVDLFSQGRPDGTDAFTAYTDAVMCEMRLEHISTKEDIFDCAESYFLMENMVSMNCVIYEDIAVLIFAW